MTPMTDPQISVCRDSKTCAVFDGFTLVREFQPYTDETAAIAEAAEWLKREHTQLTPRVIFPHITRMTMTCSRPRRKKARVGKLEKKNEG